MSDKKTWQDVIVKCWTDDEFKKKLMSDPEKTLTSEGMDIPEGLTINVVENTASSQTIIIPEKPGEEPVSSSDTLRKQVGARGCAVIISCW